MMEIQSEMETTEEAEGPNDVLARQIADALAEAGWVSEPHRQEMLAKLRSGGASQDDWNLWVDIATDPQRTDGEASHE